jgi:hypothetical protein
MTNYLDDISLADAVPIADAAEQHQSADVGGEDAVFDPEHLATCRATPTSPM